MKASIAREHQVTPLSIGGTEDHIHMLLSLPATISVAKSLQLIKGGSSKWVHDQFRQHRDFGWQEGYGAFTIGISQVAETKRYIERQKEHHEKGSFQDEFLKILKGTVLNTMNGTSGISLSSALPAGLATVAAAPHPSIDF